MTSRKKIVYRCELTDTFGGETNYSWVRRAEFEHWDNASALAIVRRAKKELEIYGRTKTRDYGGDLTLEFPRYSCLVAFITTELG